MVGKSSIDKREKMMFRETFKTLIIFLLGYILASYVSYYGFFVKPEGKDLSFITNIDVVVPNKEIKTTKDLTGSRIVLKVSKDIKKYFISYKKYTTNTDYEVFIDEISFSDYMHLNTNDTLTTQVYNGIR